MTYSAPVFCKDGFKDLFHASVDKANLRDLIAVFWHCYDMFASDYPCHYIPVIYTQHD